jgi:hypothetical protein
MMRLLPSSEAERDIQTCVLKIALSRPFVRLWHRMRIEAQEAVTIRGDFFVHVLRRYLRAMHSGEQASIAAAQTRSVDEVVPRA